MDKVTIGLPIYNGMESFAKCLDCLQAQSYENLEIIISDNHSTDGSAAFADEAARHDPRIRVIHQPENIGPQKNFVAVLQAAQGSSYFMWRAHDDLSDANYVSALVAAHERAAQEGQNTLLAAGNTLIQRFDLEGQITSENMNRIPEDISDHAVERALHQVSIYRPQWLYGLWRTQAVSTLYPHVVAHCPILTAQDILLVLAVILRDGMATSADTTLIARKLSGPRRAVSMQDRTVILEQHGTIRDYFNAVLWPPLDALDLPAEQVQYLRRMVVMSGKIMAANAGGRQRQIRQNAIRLRRSWRNHNLAPERADGPDQDMSGA